MSENKTITIDGVLYELDALSQEARAHIVNLRATEREIERLNVQLSIAQTARFAYAKALKAILSENVEIEDS